MAVNKQKTIDLINSPKHLSFLVINGIDCHHVNLEYNLDPEIIEATITAVLVGGRSELLSTRACRKYNIDLTLEGVKLIFENEIRAMSEYIKKWRQ